MKKLLTTCVLAYFRFFAQLQLKKNNPLIIGITGTAGKTSALNAVEALLQDEREIKVAHKANSETGIPLNILDLHPRNFSALEWLRLALLCPYQLLTNWQRYDTYIVEMGIDSPHPPKNMAYLLTILQPDIGILLNTSAMHSEAFDHLATKKDAQERMQEIVGLITKEKGKLLTYLSESGTAILNGDQSEVKALLPQVRARTLTFGTKHDVQVQSVLYIASLSGTTFKFAYQEQEARILFKNQLFPQHFEYTFAAAISVGLALGMSLEHCCRNIEENYRLPPGRSSLIAGMNDSWLIDSSYNSSRKPLIDMLQLLKSLESQRKYVLLGDMRELGELAQSEHELIAREVLRSCDEAVLVGPLMREYVLPILEAEGMPVAHFEKAVEAAVFLKEKIEKNDIVLVKGSQNTLLLEIAVEALMQYPQDAESMLARRGEYWDGRRSTTSFS